MLDEHDGDLEHVADLDDVLHEFLRFGGVHAGGGLVEQQQRRVRCQSADDLQTALRAVGQRAGLHVCHVLHIENGQQLQRALVRGALLPPVARQAEYALKRGIRLLIVQADLHVILDSEVTEKADVLERAGNAHAVDLLGRFAGGVHAVKQNGAAGRLIDLGKEVKNGGLARAVRADQPGDLGAADGEIEVVHGAKSAEIDAEMAAFQHGCFVQIALGDDGCAREFDHFPLFKLFRHLPSPPSVRGSRGAAAP